MIKKFYYAFLTVVLTLSGIVAFSTLNISGNIKFLSVKSGSMEPSIKVGSIVMIKPQKIYRKGDIITVFDSANHKITITHRITNLNISNNEKFYTTKGDANKTEDSEKRLEKDIVGKVLLTVPFLGYAVEFARTKYGLILLVIIPAIIIIYKEVDNIKTNFKKSFSKSPFLILIFALFLIPTTKSYLVDTTKMSTSLQAGTWEINPKLDFYFENTDKNKVGFTLSGDELKNYYKLEYKIIYDSNQGIQVIEGSKNIEDFKELKEKNLIIGSCSSGGTCSYNTNVSKIDLVITLNGLHLKSSLNAYIIP